MSSDDNLQKTISFLEQAEIEIKSTAFRITLKRILPPYVDIFQIYTKSSKTIY